MPIELEFIDWSKPALPAAARWFAGRIAAGANLDLADVIVCVPGAQARRRLLELLVEIASEQGLMLAPPRIVTPGTLPELLYEAKQPFASDLTQQLAWVNVLQEAAPVELGPFVAKLPERDDLPAWLALGQMLANLHRELAADGLDCEAVLKEGAQCEGFNEAAAVVAPGQTRAALPAFARWVASLGQANGTALCHRASRMSRR